MTRTCLKAEVHGGHGLDDQLEQWWNSVFLVEELKFDQHPMHPCVFVLRAHVYRAQHTGFQGELLMNQG